MKIQNATLLITGANRGLGLAFARAALARGARKVYAGARDPSTVVLPGVQPVKLDVTREDDIAAVAAACSDVTLVINNAGIAAFGGFLAQDSVASARRHMETNYFGPLLVGKAFAPILAANGGGGIINVLSIASWINGPMLATYAASKSAAWALTNGLRLELQEQGTQVLGLHAGFIDTDLTRGLDVAKITPESVVQQAFDGLENGASEVLTDDRTRYVKQHLSSEPGVYLMPISA